MEDRHDINQKSKQAKKTTERKRNSTKQRGLLNIQRGSITKGLPPNIP